MSIAYNRRRGAKADKSRTPRQCAHLEPPPYAHNQSKLMADEPQRCPQLAPVNRYCPDHGIRPSNLPEGPISRRLRLDRQAQQAATKGTKLTAAQKIVWKRLRAVEALQTFLQGLVGYSRMEKVKSAVKKLNPWAT